MDQVAELGIASHWSYKEKGSNVRANMQNAMEQKLQFFRSIMELNQEQLTDEEFYGIIDKLNPFCKDGKRRNGNVVYRLKLRGIDVDRYYDELGRASS
jgi:hypothetical protein